MNRRRYRYQPDPAVLAKLRLCGRVCEDDSPVTEFERRRHAQLIAEEMARRERKRDLFNDDPEVA